ncbi:MULTISPECIES: ester cyclase [unclassified Enterobacter]|jgi:predicted ester cyclase|uniref:ester cyclase n=1 Tax=unclassified Enterobacter TaxID=2608935 RepID=UPI0015C98BAE|nr:MULTISPECIES: ester cyclase [unclassified Enterobacter]MBB3306854.1 putative ester cyclase [Enterobacter sp. Sphag1F]NYI15822.1 putative ester cyclase [Enterobacter sp. Sphag71]
MNVTTELNQRLKVEREAVEMLYRAFSDKNPDLLDLAVTKDWNDIPLGPGQGPGPEGFKPLLAGFIKAFPDINITVHNIVQEPGKIAVRAEITGTHHGEFMGIAPTGCGIRVRLHEFHLLDGERVTTTWHMEDWLAMFQQLGQFPPA